jgi:hypothetical protein
LIHSGGLPSFLSKSHRFKEVIGVARTANGDFMSPNLRLIGGELLRLNFESCQEHNTVVL